MIRFKELLDDSRVGSEIREWGANDTETRSVITNYLTQKLIGKQVPLIGERADMTRFWDELHNKALKMGYKTRRMSALVRAECLEVRADQAETEDQLDLMRKLAEAAELAYYSWALECKGMAIRAKVYNGPTIEIVNAYKCAYEALISSYRCAQRAAYYSNVNPSIELEIARIRASLHEALFEAV